MKWITMEPQVMNVSREAIAQYEQTRPFASGFVENEAWIEVKGKCYAVGYLAATRFCGNEALKVLKYERAIYKVLALVGVIASQNRMPQEISLDLGVLLPFGEYQDRERFYELVKNALSSFSFQKKEYQVKLERFDCLPEGGGLLMRGMKPGCKQTEGGVIMVGYRNASYLLMERGGFSAGETKDLGFIKMVELVAETTSGLSAEQLVGPICQAGHRVKKAPLKCLARSEDGEQAALEIESLAKSIGLARKQYWQMLSDWLSVSQLPPISPIILAGGTAHYYL